MRSLPCDECISQGASLTITRNQTERLLRCHIVVEVGCDVTLCDAYTEYPEWNDYYTAVLTIMVYNSSLMKHRVTFKICWMHWYSTRLVKSVKKEYLNSSCFNIRSAVTILAWKIKKKLILQKTIYQIHDSSQFLQTLLAKNSYNQI